LYGQFRTELQIHAKMRHPNIVEFYRAFSFENHTYVVLELCPNGSLMEMVKSRGSLSLPEVRRYMIQLCGGVKYMHRRCVIHRDLKMGNIFLDSHMDVKIGDFGLAAVVLDEKDRRQTLCGTPNYIAPEILSKSGGNGHDNKVDTWAVGIICYAMLIGSPPFASKTQAEIYSKLKLLQYDWKENDSQNFIPLQAKQLVSSCLNLNGTERPEMDDLVEHEFFKMGAIAEELEPTCRTTKPRWLENADPRGDKVQPGYGIEYNKICHSSGVGRSPSGKSRPSVGENMNKSAMAEVELENAQGCAPVIPLPDGVIYQQFTAARKEWVSTRKFPVRTALVKTNEFPPQVQADLDTSGVTQAVNDIEVTPTLSGPTIHAAAVNVPAPKRPIQSFAAQQREQALPSRTLSSKVDPKEEVRPTAVTKMGDIDVPASQGFLRERPLRATSTRSLRSNSNRDATFDPQRAMPKSNTISAGMSRALGARPAQQESQPEEKPATIGRSASHRPLHTRTSSRALESMNRNSTRITSVSQSADKQSDTQSRILQPTTANDRQPPENRSEKLVESKQVKTSSGRSRPRLMSTSESVTILKGSTPSAIIASLRRLHENLSPTTTSWAPSNNSNSSSLNSQIQHTVVEKWVDYTNKYGIAYILSDSTVGVVLKSSDDGSKASSCIVVRNSRRFYTRRSQKLEAQIVPQDDGAMPVEFYEQCGDEGMRRVEVPAATYKLDAERFGGDTGQATSDLAERLKRKDNGGSAEAERLKLVVLADKFGKYMTKTLGSEEVDDEADTHSTGNTDFVSFYQRLGNVGVWGYGGGGFQFNFPDHTKMVVYEQEALDARAYLMLDLYYLQAADASYLAKHGSFKPKALERRNLVTLSVRNILDGTIAADPRMKRKGYPEIVASNEVKEKLAWIRGVLGCWIKEGGVGKMGGEKLGWTGLQERGPGDERKAKLVWVSVGRAGGDCDSGKAS
jgi:serine/threonine protein kinase